MDNSKASKVPLSEYNDRDLINLLEKIKADHTSSEDPQVKEKRRKQWIAITAEIKRRQSSINTSSPLLPEIPAVTKKEISFVNVPPKNSAIKKSAEKQIQNTSKIRSTGSSGTKAQPKKTNSIFLVASMLLLGMGGIGLMMSGILDAKPDQQEAEIDRVVQAPNPLEKLTPLENLVVSKLSEVNVAPTEPSPDIAPTIDAERSTALTPSKSQSTDVQGKWVALEKPTSITAPKTEVELPNPSATSMSPKPASPFNKASHQPFGLQGKWTLVDACSDEFNDSKVDEDKWEPIPKSWGCWSWERDNVWVKDGKLNLQMRQKTHKRKNVELYYTSGIIRSNNKITYGYFEARIKGCHTFPGACPAFWLYSHGKEAENQLPEHPNLVYSEIDVMEIQQKGFLSAKSKDSGINHIDLNLHTRILVDGKVEWRRPNSLPDLCRRSWTAPWDPRDDFHIYGAECTPEKVIWYIDGKKVAESKNVYWHLPMSVTLSLGLRPPLLKYVDGEPVALKEAVTQKGFPTVMQVDWVRSYVRVK